MLQRCFLYSPAISFISVILVLSFPPAANAQTLPSWVGQLFLRNSTITADPSLTAPEAQGLGQKFELLYAMKNAQDPQNHDNDVISVLTTPGTTAAPGAIGVAVRNMLPGAKIATLTNQISIKYFFPARSCDGGSPRIQLSLILGTAHRPTTRSAILATEVSARAASQEYGILLT